MIMTLQNLSTNNTDCSLTPKGSQGQSHANGQNDQSEDDPENNLQTFLGRTLVFFWLGLRGIHDGSHALGVMSCRRVRPALPDDTTVWPGHDYGCRAASTIALEKAFNPFLLAEDFDAFMALKRDWASFKAENGLA